jgi:hypothetical protein
MSTSFSAVLPNACVSRLRGLINNWRINRNLSNKTDLAGRLDAMLGIINAARKLQLLKRLARGVCFTKLLPTFEANTPILKMELPLDLSF